MSNSEAHQSTVVNDQHTTRALPLLLQSTSLHFLLFLLSISDTHSSVRMADWAAVVSNPASLTISFASPWLSVEALLPAEYVHRLDVSSTTESFTFPTSFEIQSNKKDSVFSPLHFSEVNLWKIGLLYLLTVFHSFCGRVHWDMSLAVWVTLHCRFQLTSKFWHDVLFFSSDMTLYFFHQAPLTSWEKNHAGVWRLKLCQNSGSRRTTCHLSVFSDRL